MLSSIRFVFARDGFLVSHTLRSVETPPLFFATACSRYIGCIIHLSVTIVQNVRLMLEVRSYNWVTIGTYLFSISAWFVLMTMFANLQSLSYAFASKYAVGMDKQVNEDALMWITVLLSVHCVDLAVLHLQKPGARCAARLSTSCARRFRRRTTWRCVLSPSSGVVAACCGGGARAASNAIMDRLQRRRRQEYGALWLQRDKVAGRVDPYQGTWQESVGSAAMGASGVEMVSRRRRRLLQGTQRTCKPHPRPWTRWQPPELLEQEVLNVVPGDFVVTNDVRWKLI